MTDKTVVILLRENSKSCGDVNEFDKAEDAEHYIEGLLEAGYERERIRVMGAHGLIVEVTPMPVVSLHAAVPVERPARKERVERVRAPALDDHGMELAGESSPASPGPAPADAEDGPYTRNGVRFSTAFTREP
ncbi:MAG TPA: hypothetical protein VFP63_05740 [Dehalococcoidia bacterium]|nr:hypothetical protein [Dehalococcoidia bacterium]